MQVQHAMIPDPKWCSLDTGLQAVSRLMVDCDCGEIPVCDADKRLIGVVTDRDIVCRILARGENPFEHSASDCMSRPVVTVSPNTSLGDAARLMQEHQVRRLPVVDEAGICCGMLAQADLAVKAPPELAGHVVERISQPPASR